MNELEVAIMNVLLAGDDERLEVLRRQLSVATVISRELTGVGFFTTFAVPPSAPRVVGSIKNPIADVYAEISGLEHEAGFLLFLDDGALDTLEAFIVDDNWPDVARAIRVFYVHPSGGAALRETEHRDLAWSLGPTPRIKTSAAVG